MFKWSAKDSLMLWNRSIDEASTTLTQRAHLFERNDIFIQRTNFVRRFKQRPTNCGKVSSKNFVRVFSRHEFSFDFFINDFMVTKVLYLLTFSAILVITNSY